MGPGIYCVGEGRGGERSSVVVGRWCGVGLGDEQQLRDNNLTHLHRARLALT